MFIGPLLFGSFLGYLAAAVALLLGLAIWPAVLTLIVTGHLATGLLLALLALHGPWAESAHSTALLPNAL